jgi:hypothetical protein
MIPSDPPKEAAEIWAPPTRFKVMFEIQAHVPYAIADAATGAVS